MPHSLDFSEWGLSQFSDPRTAQDASADDLRRLLQAMVALLGGLSCEISTSDRHIARRLQTDFDNANKTAIVLMSLLRTERELAR
jgi:hypothetical protein